MSAASFLAIIYSDAVSMGVLRIILYRHGWTLKNNIDKNIAMRRAGPNIVLWMMGTTMVPDN